MKMLSKRGTMWILVLQICLFLRYCLVFTSKFNSYSDFVFFGLQVSCISIWFFCFHQKNNAVILILVFSAVSSFQQGNSWKKDEFCISFGSFFNVFSFDQYFFCRFKQFFFFAVLLILLGPNALFPNGLLCELPSPGIKALLGLNSDKPDDLETATQDRWNGNKWN